MSQSIRWSPLRSLSAPARAAGVLLLCAALAGCGSSRAGHAPTAADAPSARRPAAPAQAVRAANGVPMPAEARRIVSLSDAATEDLFAVGAGSQVVAADQFSTYPSNAPRTSLSGTSPNVEAIVRYRPDLVVVSQDAGHVDSLLAALHVPVLDEPAPSALNGAYAQMEQLGRATGHAARATRLVAALRHRVAGIVASVRRPGRPLTVYHELDPTHYSASSHTFVGQIYALLGLRNIADGAAGASVYPQLSDEHIIAADPDLIVLADTVCCGQTVAKIRARPGWSQLSAVRHGAVLTVDDTIASEWGPRIVDFLAQVAAGVRRLEGRS